VGVFSFVPMTGDFDSTVSPLNTYTHAVDYFKGSGTPAVVNGVKFNGDTDAPGGQGNWTLANVGNTLSGGGSNFVTGGIGSVVNDFRYGGDANGVATLTLKGLTPGVSYVTNFYNRVWATVPRNVDLTTSDGGTFSFDQDAFAVGTG
jgi:hypothetical protein